ncbi:MAG: RsmE family RNA methyltransferase [Thermoleophilia bacterium]
MKHIYRFFLSQDLSPGDQPVLDADDCFHATKVLRLRAGDEVELAAADESVYRGRVVSSGDDCRVAVDALIASGRSTPGLTVVQALPRGRKLDLVVEKLSELGVERLVPVSTSKSVAPPPAPGEKMKRWRRIARSSAAQAKRTAVMRIDEPVALSDWLRSAAGTVIALSTENDPAPLGQVVAGVSMPLALVVGPESGFSDDEIESLAAGGVGFAGLGGLVLRTETAALVAATVVLHRLGGIG